MRAIVAALAVAAAGCATSGTMPSASVTTLMPSSERWFRLSWQATPESGSDLVRLRGEVENTFGEAAASVQLLGQALDASGEVVGQRIVWLGPTIGGFGRRNFEIPNMPTADHYCVTVWSFERIQAPGGWW